MDSKLLCRWLCTLSLAALVHGGACQTTSGDLWINEFHYEDTGLDANEFVEVVIAPSMVGIVLTTVDLTLYNGSGGGIISTHGLEDFTLGATVNGYEIYSLAIPGIQNGAPDGLALSISGVLIAGQFLSYEGTFTATAGPANGQMSTDIGLAESDGSTLDTQSLQLTGTGSVYADFTWAGPATSSAGGANSGQSFVAVPEPGAFLLCGLVVLAAGTAAIWRRVLTAIHS
jgi:hypothetical protein